MSTAAAVPMVTKVVAGTAAKGYSDIERATGGVNGNGKEIPRISIRRATLSEACSVTSLVNDAYRHPISLFAVEGCTRVTPDGTQVTTLMEQPCNAILVAEETNVGDGSSVTVGCVQVDWTGTTICKGTSVDARFGLLSVPKRYSGRGVGTLLISAAEKCCRRELGRADIVMEVLVMSKSPKLCDWYKAQGYEMRKIIPFDTPCKVREGVDVKLLQMTKTIS